MAGHGKGKVKRIYPYAGGCYIQLNYNGAKPKDGYFHLDKGHPNYNSLYSLAVVAAVNSYTLLIRVSPDIVPTEHGNVVYMYIDW